MATNAWKRPDVARHLKESARKAEAQRRKIELIEKLKKYPDTAAREIVDWLFEGRLITWDERYVSSQEPRCSPNWMAHCYKRSHPIIKRGECDRPIYGNAGNMFYLIERVIFEKFPEIKEVLVELNTKGNMLGELDETANPPEDIEMTRLRLTIRIFELLRKRFLRMYCGGKEKTIQMHLSNASLDVDEYGCSLNFASDRDYICELKKEIEEAKEMTCIELIEACVVKERIFPLGIYQ